MPIARLLFHAATIAAVALTIWSVVGEPIPLAWAVVALVAYTTLMMLGVVWMPLEVFADSINRGPRDASGVVLTFDDGPSPEHTPKILALLEAEGAHATFFVLGEKAEKYPEIVREIARRGHTLALHGYHHDRLVALRGAARIRADIERAAKVVEDLVGLRPTLYRPPVGHTSPRVAKAADDAGVTLVGWSVRGYDGLARAKPDEVAARVTRGLEDGALVLLHDAAERDDHTPAALAALPKILAAMHARNLRTAELTDWV